MRIRRLWLIVVAILVPSAAGANDHVADFFGGFSYGNASNLFGLHNALGITLPQRSKNLSALVDVSLHIGSHDGNDLTRTTYLFGGRYMFDDSAGYQRHVPFVYGMIGGIHDGASVGSNAFAGAVGGGWEYFPGGNDRSGGVAARVQVDYVFAGNDKAFTRVTGGVVYRVGGPKNPKTKP